MIKSRKKESLKMIFCSFSAILLLIGSIFFVSGCETEKSQHTHDYTSERTAPTCTEQGYTTYTCACGESYVSDIIEKLNHTPDGAWEIVTSATDVSNGLKIQKCSSCGEKTAEEILVASLDLDFISYGNGVCYVQGIGNCKDTDIVIPSVYKGMRVTEINNFAFSDCSEIRTIVIPDSVTSIGLFPFSNSSNLISITVDSNNPNYASVDGVLFNKAITELIRYPSAKTGAYTIPNTVTSIGDEAFMDCVGLTSLVISERLSHIGNRAFTRCRSLMNITADSNNPNYASVDGVLFNKALTILICYPNGRTGAYTIPNTVITIGRFSFMDCNGLTGITIPDSVTAIGDYTFKNCNGLTSITVPLSVTSIGRSAFEYCYNLTNITFLGTTSEWYAISKGFNWKYKAPVQYAICSDGNWYLL